MPPPNDHRRALLTDAAIALLAEAGVHGVTHRAVEKRAGLPGGTASNYFRSREALLVATAERVLALHQADMAAAPPPAGSPSREQVVELIAGSLLLSATTHRARYLAIFELRLEGLRRPALAQALEGLGAGMLTATAAHHSERALPVPTSAVPAMVGLFGGALFTLVTAEPDTVTPERTTELARAIVAGALAVTGTE